MEFVTAYDAFTRDQPPEPESERICVIAREHGEMRPEIIEI